MTRTAGAESRQFRYEVTAHDAARKSLVAYKLRSAKQAEHVLGLSRATLFRLLNGTCSPSLQQRYRARRIHEPATRVVERPAELVGEGQSDDESSRHKPIVRVDSAKVT